MATLPSYGASGLTILTLTEIQENLRESVFNASALGPEVSTGDHTILGMHLDANAIELSTMYELLDDIVAAMDPDSAEGVQQDNLNRLRGAIRNPARFSTCPVVLTGTPTTSITAGSIVGIGSDGEQWAIDTTVVVGGGGTVAGQVTAVNSGPIEAAGGSPGAINTIITGISGWTGVNNTVDATLGEDVETDTDYRNRSEDTGTGTTTEEAIFTRLSELDDVDAVVVTSNRTDTTDALGTLPHQLWAVIYPNTANQQDIAETIWGTAGAPAGINMRGAVTATVTDSNGVQQQIRWDWATAVDVWVSVVGTKDADYPAGGDQLVKDAIVAHFATVDVGGDVNPLPIEAAVANAVPGITVLEARMKIGGAPGPSDTSPLTIPINEYADLNATVGVTIT
jgi:hypothetical protein